VGAGDLLAVRSHDGVMCMRSVSALNRFRITVVPFVLSTPHYIAELQQIDSLSALGNWIYFKFPFAFPVASVPLYVTVELTTLCNLGCPHCWRLGAIEQRGLGSMSVRTFEKIIEDISTAKNPPVVLKIAGAGEPVFHPHFEEFMSLLDGLKERGVHTIVYTNGALFEKFSARDITRWNIQRIVISIDGVDQESYEKIRIGGDYHKVRSLACGFRDFRDRLSSEKPWIEIRHVIIQEETVRQLFQFRGHWIPPGDTVKFQRLQPVSREVGNAFVPTVSDNRQIRRELHIQWNGNVPLSGGVDQFAGNVNSQSIEELWRSIHVLTGLRQ
jgi:pyruvate-formate lyase-activating enzyme